MSSLRRKHDPLKRMIQLTALAWVMMAGVDFFVHGGLSAAMYLQDSPFLLARDEAFRRIPFGYLALLLTAGLLVWIMHRMTIRGWRQGLLVGLSLGLVFGLSSTLGLYSISTAGVQILAAWFIAQVMEMAVAGAIIGRGLHIGALRGLIVAVIVGFVLLFVLTIAIQNIGLAP